MAGKADYVLDDDQYEIVDKESKGRITSEKVREKLFSPGEEPILQGDFEDSGGEEDEDYTLADYLLLKNETVTERRDVKASMAGSGAGSTVGTAGLVYGTGEPAYVGAGLLAFAMTEYNRSLIEQDGDFTTAVGNSLEELRERFLEE